MLQLTDLRAPTDFTAQMQVRVDDGFWISVNQPAAIDESAMNQVFTTVDRPGFFENLGMQGPTTYRSGSCTPFNSATPNIMKLYHQDAGGGWAAFQFTMFGCAGTPAMDSMYLSLTCEPRAPFLRYEVSGRSRFEELRNPGLFGQFLELTSLDMHTRTDEQQSVPGKKSFTRLNVSNSMINMKNIAYQSWKTMTAAIRFQSMAVKESIINLACGPVGSWYCNLIVLPVNGGMMEVRIEYRITGNQIQTATTAWRLAVNEWYLFRIDNIGTGFVIYCDWIPSLIRDKRPSGSSVVINGSRQLWDANATWNPAPGQVYESCNIMFGTANYKGWSSMYGSGACTYDLAWVHFFDNVTNDNDIYRDVMNDWIFTQFVSDNGTYS